MKPHIARFKFPTCAHKYCFREGRFLLYVNTDNPVGAYCWGHARHYLAVAEQARREELIASQDATEAPIDFTLEASRK